MVDRPYLLQERMEKDETFLRIQIFTFTFALSYNFDYVTDHVWPEYKNFGKPRITGELKLY